MKKDKNDRLIWDGTFISNWNAVSINMMLNHESEPEIIYGDTFNRYLHYLHNFRITIPDSDILVYDDDVKSAFRHYKYHPDITAAFAFIIQNLLWIPLGGDIWLYSYPHQFRANCEGKKERIWQTTNRQKGIY